MQRLGRTVHGAIIFSARKARLRISNDERPSEVSAGLADWRAKPGCLAPAGVSGVAVSVAKYLSAQAPPGYVLMYSCTSVTRAGAQISHVTMYPSTW